MRAPPEAVTTTRGVRVGQGVLGGGGDPFADRAAEAAAHEREVHHRGDDAVAEDGGGPAHDGLREAGASAGVLQPGEVGPGVGEGQRVVQCRRDRQRGHRARVQELLQPLGRAQPLVVPAVRAHAKAPAVVLAVHRVLAAGTADPQRGGAGGGRGHAIRSPVAGRRASGRIWVPPGGLAEVPWPATGRLTSCYDHPPGRWSIACGVLGARPPAPAGQGKPGRRGGRGDACGGPHRTGMPYCEIALYFVLKRTAAARISPDDIEAAIIRKSCNR